MSDHRPSRASNCFRSASSFSLQRLSWAWRDALTTTLRHRKRVSTHSIRKKRSTIAIQTPLSSVKGQVDHPSNLPRRSPIQVDTILRSTAVPTPYVSATPVFNSDWYTVKTWIDGRVQSISWFHPRSNHPNKPSFPQRKTAPSNARNKTSQFHTRGNPLAPTFEVNARSGARLPVRVAHPRRRPGAGSVSKPRRGLKPRISWLDGDRRNSRNAHWSAGRGTVVKRHMTVEEQWKKQGTLRWRFYQKHVGHPYPGPGIPKTFLGAKKPCPPVVLRFNPSGREGNPGCDDPQIERYRTMFFVFSGTIFSTDGEFLCRSWYTPINCCPGVKRSLTSETSDRFLKRKDPN